MFTCHDAFAPAPQIMSKELAQWKADVEAMEPPAPELLKFIAIATQFEDDHAAVIKKWGRYPHRNEILGREPTPEEEAGLKDGSIKGW